MSLRRKLTDALPLSFRRAVRVLFWKVGWLFESGRMAGLQGPGGHTDAQDFQVRIEVRLPIVQNPFVEGKVHNLELGATALARYRLEPGQRLSFWRAVRSPTASRGFQLGRTIRSGVVQPEMGGGLCQLSGLLYYLALKANLGVRERHPHSRDLYTELDRHIPLGCDAAVAFGYKDLVIENTLDGPVRLSFEIIPPTTEPGYIAGRVLAPMPIHEHALDIVELPAQSPGRKVVGVTVLGENGLPAAPARFSTYEYEQS